MTVFAGDVLTATAAPVYSDLTPTRTWQWLRGSTSIAGATTTTYRATDADVGSTLAVNQIETNFLGSTTATSAATATVGSWSPTTLFASSEPGVWYDTDDYTTMFQDSAGTTPVTGANQPVGLLLDKSKGLVLGNELVTNGSFDSGTGWTLGSGWSISGGLLSFDGSAVFANVSQAMSLVQNRTYLLTFTSTGTIAAIRMGGATAGSNVAANITGSGVKTFRVSCPGTDGTLYIVSQSTSAATLDNVSVKELPGNHAIQSTAASRPTTVIRPLNAERRNLLTFTEQFDNAVWQLGPSGVGTITKSTANAAAAPDGTTTADRVIFNLNGGTTTGDIALLRQAATAPAGSATHSVYLRSFDGVSSYVMQIIGADGNASNITVTPAWQRFSITATSPGSAINYGIRLRGGQSPANSNTADVLIWGAQLEAAASATDYQKVVTTNEWYDPAVPSYRSIQFDGVDDFLVTPTITPGTDKAQVFAGVRKLSDAAVGIVSELSTDTTNSGVFSLAAPIVAGAGSYRFNAKGTASPPDARVSSGYAAPISNILTGIGDISADNQTLRINGTQVAQSTDDQGTGNFLAYPIYIGRRGGTTLPFNGILTSLVVRFGANLSTSVINRAEYYVSNKTGVTL